MEELRRQLVTVALRFLRQTEAAEDVAQETFLRLLKARSNGRLVVDERAYATRTAVRLAIDRLRTDRSRDSRNRALHDVRPESGEPSAPVEVQRLYDAIAALPPKQSAVITLRKIMELGYADIAAILGISEENCRSHCRHGLLRLREMLHDEET